MVDLREHVGEHQRLHARTPRHHGVVPVVPAGAPVRLAGLLSAEEPLRMSGTLSPAASDPIRKAIAINAGLRPISGPCRAIAASAPGGATVVRDVPDRKTWCPDSSPGAPPR